MRLPGRPRRRRRNPRLSVVVPVYNVADYLAECLDSINAQDFGDFEVIMVDDGSTDRSAQIASDYVARHSHMRLIRTGNHGLGSARNTAMREARGDYLTFVDSDDSVPPYSFGLLVSTLDESGSDVAVGALTRMTADRTFVPPWLRRLHRERRIGIALEDFPDIIGDVFACNKAFRRTFWESGGFSFPEGIRYEDQVTLTEVYLKAAALDVLVRPVYHWRIRDDGTSITQRRHELEDLRDRIVTKQLATEQVEQLGSPAVKTVWYRQVLPGDLPQYFWQIPGCDAAYWRMLHEGVRTLWAEAPVPISASTMRTHMRVVGWLVAHNRRTEAERILTYVDEHDREPPQVRRGHDVLVVLPFLDDPNCDIPAELFRLGAHEPVRVGD